jgi:hypothetical protein
MTQLPPYHESAADDDPIEVDGVIYRREPFLGPRTAEDWDGIFAALSMPSMKRPRKPPKPSIARLVEQAKAAGVTAVTLPDGTKLELGTPDSKQRNPLDEWMAKKKPSNAHQS